MPHLSDVRAAKSPFQLATILSTVKETAIASVAKDLKPTASVWEAISEHVSQLMEGGNKLLPLILEQDNVQKSKRTCLSYLTSSGLNADPYMNFCVCSHWYSSLDHPRRRN